MAEKIPSSHRFGSRPKWVHTRSHSSFDRPMEAAFSNPILVGTLMLRLPQRLIEVIFSHPRFHALRPWPALDVASYLEFFH